MKAWKAKKLKDLRTEKLGNRNTATMKAENMQNSESATLKNQNTEILDDRNTVNLKN